MVTSEPGSFGGESGKDELGYLPYMIERRCQMTGGQLTAGDVLSKLNIDPFNYTNTYALLRQASEGTG